MSIYFKIALIASMFAPALWFLSGLIFRTLGSPFPRITNKWDIFAAIAVWLAVLAALTAIISAAVGVVLL